MATVNLDKMSVKELMDFDGRVKKAILSAKEREKSLVKKKVDAIIENAGMNAEDLATLYGFGFGRGRGVRKGTKVAPKYRNPQNHTETWTGRGRQPRWLAARLSKGGKLADYLI